MNKWQKETGRAALNDEAKVIKDLKKTYEQARKDCEERIASLNSRQDMQNLQSIIYQKQYQQALKTQLDGICDTLNAEQFTTVSEYLTKCYETGYIGTMYDLQKQGIPIIAPIRQDQVVKAVQLNSKISNGLYSRMGEDVADLKKAIRSELSRGISNGSSWLDIAKDIAGGMNSPFNKAMNRTVTIARTEGHRIQQEAAWNAQKTAKEKGADVVKQWDATLDDKTRDTHRQLDGKIVEVDEPFMVDGLSAMFPGDFGDPAEDCNCRCQVLQRAKWALDEDELEELKERAEFFGLDKTEDFEDFREKYLNAAESDDIINKNVFNTVNDPMVEAMGSAEESNPREVDQMISHLNDLGVELVRPSFEKLAYEPGIIAGVPGKVYISEGASYSAWCHEVKHVNDDQVDGWLGMRVFSNPQKCIQREIDAYQIEIDLATDIGRTDLVERLKQLRDAEISKYQP